MDIVRLDVGAFYQKTVPLSRSGGAIKPPGEVRLAAALAASADEASVSAASYFTPKVVPRKKALP